jgi:hypothetical protein
MASNDSIYRGRGDANPQTKIAHQAFVIDKRIERPWISMNQTSRITTIDPEDASDMQSQRSEKPVH